MWRSVARSDPTKSDSYRELDQWGERTRVEILERKNPGERDFTFKSNSLSGKERNRMFLQRNGNFVDTTLVSGADIREDSRGFVLFDFDKDGWTDIGVVSVGQPRLQIFHNSIGDTFPQNSSVEIRLVGGNREAGPSKEWSSRDGYGAVVLVTQGGTSRKFQLACSEGLASQNRRAIHVGMGEAKKIDRIVVTWPSGKESEVTNVEAGRAITIYENAAEASQVR